MKKYENLYWYREKDTIRTATAYQTEKQAVGFQTKYGGKLIKELQLPFELDGNLVGFAQRTIERPSLPFSVYVVDHKGDETPRFLIAVSTRTEAFDLMRIVAHSVHAVLVVEYITPSASHSEEDNRTSFEF